MKRRVGTRHLVWRNSMMRLAAVAVALACPSWSHATDAVLLSGERIADGKIMTLAAREGDAKGKLSTADGQREFDSLVRWGEPREPGRRPGVLTVDGSLLLSDRDWSPRGLVTIEEDRIGLRRGAGWVDLPRESVVALWLNPDTPVRYARGDDAASDRDTVMLTSGDRLEGEVLSLDDRELTLSVEGEAITTPRFRVESVRFASPTKRPSSAATLIGFTDGSLVRSSRAAISGDKARVALAGGGQLVCEAADIALVQPLPGDAVRYLSDLAPVDYRHTPYLDLAWPYGRDAAPRGGPLAGGGRRVAKGVSLHSAARLVYRLDGSRQRFFADVAVADSPDGEPRGSVGCAVYLVRDGRFVAAWQSETLRGGDTPATVEVDCAGAGAIALVVDYADDGDAGDDALWMDARLERVP